jgi:hypothetical protein
MAKIRVQSGRQRRLRPGNIPIFYAPKNRHKLLFNKNIMPIPQLDSVTALA